MSSEIIGEALSLSNIFGDAFEFHIPPYQRPYSWTTEETYQLFEDLLDAYKSGDEESYFLGSIVLIKENTDKTAVDVIDGQQRLTTLTILFAAIATLSPVDLRADCVEFLQQKGNKVKKKESRPRLTLRDKDQPFFLNYVQNLHIDKLKSVNDSSLPEAQRHIKENAVCLADCLNQTFGNDEEALADFSAFISEKCYLVAVTTTSRESAFRIFSVMNNRGLNLQVSDIIKSDVIGQIPSNEQIEYTNKWETLEELVGNVAFNEVLSHIAMIFIKGQYRKGLLEQLKERVLPQTTHKGFIDNILDPYVRAYETLKNINYSASTHAEEVNRQLEWLNKIDNYDWIPSAILGMNRYRFDTDRLLLFLQKLERLAYFMAVTGMIKSSRWERYRPVLKELEDAPLPDDKLFRSLELSDDEKKSFIRALDGPIYRTPVKRRNFIVQRLDSFVADGAAKYDNRVFTLEHVLPQNPSKGSEWERWWPDEDERAEWTHRIANLVPLTRSKNSSAGNYRLAQKIKVYLTSKEGVSSYALTSSVLSLKEWTPEIVKERQLKLLTIFCQRWDLFPSGGKSAFKKLFNWLADDEESDCVPSKSSHTPTPTGPVDPQKVEGETFYMTRGEANAYGMMLADAHFVVKAGSVVSGKINGSCPLGVVRLREEYRKSGVLVNNELQEDVEFYSPSGAAGFVCASAANGYDQWKDANGVTLGERTR